MTVSLDLKNPSDLTTRKTLLDISSAVANSKRVVVITGAGISCSSGIPDFRSTEGLYNLVKSRYPDVVVKGRDLFDASLFRNPMSTAIFYTFIAGLKTSIDAAHPSPTHHFIKALDNKGKLLRSYTQNIDGLETQAGLLASTPQDALAAGKGESAANKVKRRIKDVKNVLLHGDIHRVRCTLCSANYPCDKAHVDAFLDASPPPCPDCSSRSAARVARSARPLAVGTLRPAIVLYNEPHPLGEEIGTIQTDDLRRKPDLLIIMGTSLKVDGLKKLVKDFAKSVHQGQRTTSSKAAQVLNKVIFVNLTEPGSEWSGIIDYHVKGETDAWVEKVLVDWKKAKPDHWMVQKTLDQANVRVVKEIGGASKSKKLDKKVSTSKKQSENVAPYPSSSQSSQKTLVDPFDDDDIPFASGSRALGGIKTKTFTKPRQKSVSAPQLSFRAPPLSPSKRQNRTYTSSSKSRSASSSTLAMESECESDAESPMYDSESERSSPRKKRRAPDDMSIDDIVVPVMPKEERGLLFSKGYMAPRRRAVPA